MPGLREIRGPLVAGYLWLFAAWLALEDRLPTSKSNETFERLWNLADSVGPIALAATASVAAYLIGSLLSAIFAAALKRWRDRGLRLISRPYGLPSAHDIDDRDWLLVKTLLDTEQHGARRYFDLPFADVGVAESLVRLEETELSEVRGRLMGAVHHALAMSDDAAYVFLRWQDGDPVVGVPREDVDLTEVVIPQYSPYDDLWQNRPLLETRLREQAASTASKIERIDAEADFREAISPPLVALAIVLALQISWFWLGLLVIPAALFVQARLFRRSASRELADALRARSGTTELEQISPVFAKYREHADRLSDALLEANWKNSTYLEERVQANLVGADTSGASSP